MATYRSMLDLRIPTRRAASLTGVSRTTANRKPAPPRDQAKHPPRAVPELVATAPGQVYTWDITKLAGPVKGKYF